MRSNESFSILHIDYFEPRSKPSSLKFVSDFLLQLAEIDMASLKAYYKSTMSI